MSLKLICPRHEGAYDCTPFCEICEGEQEYQIDECREPAPEGIEITSARFGGHAVARCNFCEFTSVYWECGHELDHECERG